MLWKIQEDYSSRSNPELIVLQWEDISYDLLDYNDS